MGTEWRLFDHEHKLYYELGRGPWLDLSVGAVGKVVIDDISPSLYEAVYKCIEFFDLSEGPSREEYAREIANGIESRMGPELFLISDFHDDYYDYEDYVKIGSRYR